MQLITHTQPHILIADEGKHIRAINDIYESERIDKKTGKINSRTFSSLCYCNFSCSAN